MLDVNGEVVPCVLRFRAGMLVWCREGEERAFDVYRDDSVRLDALCDESGEIPESAFTPSELKVPRYVDFYVQSATISETHRGPMRARVVSRVYHPLRIYSGGYRGDFLGTTEVVLRPGTEITVLRRAWIRCRSDRFVAWEYQTADGMTCWVQAREIEILGPLSPLAQN